MKALGDLKWKLTRAKSKQVPHQIEHKILYTPRINHKIQRHVFVSIQRNFGGSQFYLTYAYHGHVIVVPVPLNSQSFGSFTRPSHSMLFMRYVWFFFCCCHTAFVVVDDDATATAVRFALLALLVLRFFIRDTHTTAKTITLTRTIQSNPIHLNYTLHSL